MLQNTQLAMGAFKTKHVASGRVYKDIVRGDMDDIGAGIDRMGNASVVFGAFRREASGHMRAWI